MGSRAPSVSLLELYVGFSLWWLTVAPVWIDTGKRGLRSKHFFQYVLPDQSPADLVTVLPCDQMHGRMREVVKQTHAFHEVVAKSIKVM